MIGYKLFGALSVILCGLWMFFVRESFQRKKLIQLKAYIKFFTYVKSQIECYMLPMDKILSQCDKELLANCGYHSSTTPHTIEEILEYSNMLLDSEVQNRIRAFANGFGNGYMTEEIKLCERFIADLKEICDAMSEERKKDKKLSLAICLSISLSLVLILI